LTISKEQALLLMETLPASSPSLEPCYVINWPLWFAWCEVRGREPEASTVWTEYDVVISAVLDIRKYLENVRRTQ
jgi:hypothetical protein